MTNSPDLLYQLALTSVPHIGPVQARLLLEHFETARDIFHSKVSLLEKIEGIGSVRAKSILHFRGFKEQEEAITLLEKAQIQALFLKDKHYPQRLLHCYDPPTLLFWKGSADLNATKTLSVIGTRNHTEYGSRMTEQLLEQLLSYNPVIVSGLAFGIDAIAHRKSIQCGLSTIGVLGHGLDTIYPYTHRTLANDMLEHGGGLLTEFRCKTLPDRHHFPARNRIVAGISDATIVIETAVRGGSMITACLAADYNRDLFAVPGRATDLKSSGCNHLIVQQRAILCQSGEDIAKALGWITEIKPATVARTLFVDLNKEEEMIYRLLPSDISKHIDVLYAESRFSSSQLASVLLSLELKGIIRSLPGKMYQTTE
jgi:DNA processing protein